MGRRWVAFLLAAALVWHCLGIRAFAKDTADISAASYVLMEAETGTVLLGTHETQIFSCGAMAKLMTALLAADRLNTGTWTLETTLTASQIVAGTKGAVIWLTPGETMTVGDLLKGLIIGNANDAALVLAEAISGDVATFVMDMNARAFDLGMRQTRFSSPQGDSGGEQYTTAYDLGLLCCALAQEPILTPYFQTWHDYLRDGATELVNENTLSRTDDTGIGFKATHSDGDYAIAAGATRGGMTCVTVALGCKTQDDRFVAAKTLLRRGFSGWKTVQPGFSAEFLYPLSVRGGVDRSVLIQPGTLRNLVVPVGCGELETVLVLPNYVLAPVRKGQRVGTAAFYQGDTLLYETQVVAASAVRQRNFWDAWRKLLVNMHEF